MIVINQEIIMKKLLSIFIASSILVSCSSTQVQHPLEVKNLEEIQTERNLKTYGPVAIGGQPSLETLKELKDKNYKTIINIRDEKEFKKFNERKEVETLGMKYINIPFFDKNKNINEYNLAKITKSVEQHKDHKIFLHCSSGNRAAAWLATHLHRDHNVDLNKSIKVAREAGLTKPKLEAKIVAYLNN